MHNKAKHRLDFIRSQRSAFIWFALTLIAITILTTFGPAEHSLGTHIRIVYLHGAWVWASTAAFLASGIMGSLGLATRRNSFHGWSCAFGRTGLFFWISYLPLSLWAMQSNWNGLFLAEPRWRLALAVAISGLLLQIGLTLENTPNLTSSFNIGFFVLLIFALFQTPNVLHPASPILSSEAWRIQVFFFGLFSLTLLAAWQMARWWYRGESNTVRK
jgi:hypothetical protein